MRLTSFTDYGFRVLIYLAMRPERLSTIAEISDQYGISRNHLMKVVHVLGQNDLIRTVRGKNGGMALAHPPEEIRIGDVVRVMEEGMVIVECFDPEKGECRIDGACALKGILAGARDAFLATLDQYSLLDAISCRSELTMLFFGVGQGAGNDGSTTSEAEIH